MSFGDIIIISMVVVGIIGGGLYFLNKWAIKKNAQQEQFVSTNKQFMSIYVIDKRRDKIQNVQVPKMVSEQMPKYYKFLKMYFIKAKIGPQIVTLMCSKEIFNTLTVKKTFKCEVAGIYIVSVSGMKSKAEMKQLKKDKKLKLKNKK